MRRARVESTRRHLAAIAWLMDEAVRVPGSRFRVGLGPIVGLIPVIGDLAGAAVGGYLIVRSVQAGLPRVVIAEMAANVVIDTVVGFVPLAGDAFDAVYKSNVRNLRLFEQHALDPGRSTRGSFAFLLALVAIVVAVLAGGALLVIWLVQALFAL